MKKILFLLLFSINIIFINNVLAQNNYLLAQANGVRATVTYSQINKHFDANVTIYNYSSNTAHVTFCVDFEGDSNYACDNIMNNHDCYINAGSSRTFRYWGSNDDSVVSYTVYQFNVTGGDATYSAYNQNIQPYQYGYYNGVPMQYGVSANEIAAAMKKMEQEKEWSKMRKQKTSRKVFIANLTETATVINPSTGVKTVYYFVIRADKAPEELILTRSKQTGGCSNVFAVHQHSDGSWTFFSDIKQKIAKELQLNISDFYLIGYFETENAALRQQQATLEQMKDADFKMVTYSIQNSNTNTPNNQKKSVTSDDFWGDDAKTNATTKQDTAKTTKHY